MKRELTGFTDRPHKEQQTDEGQKARAGDHDIRRNEHTQLNEVHRAEHHLHEQDADEHPEVTDARCDERFFRRLASGYLVVVEPDQQIGTQADTLPEHVELEEVDRDDKPEHGCREQ